QKPREKLLRQVLRVLGAVALAADVGVKWIPIIPAQFLQGLSGAGCRIPPRRLHDTPMSGVESLRHRCGIVVVILMRWHNTADCLKRVGPAYRSALPAVKPRGFAALPGAI